MSTIYDIAKLAGVSSCAVSKVLNGKPIHVSDVTRQRIIESAKALGYRTNRAAQQLRTGKFNTIAIYFERPCEGFFLNPIENKLIAGIGHSTLENGLSLLLTPIKSNEVFEQTIGSLSSQGVDGGIIIGLTPLYENPPSAIDDCNMPLVCFDSHPKLASVSTVDTDNFAGMKMGVAHLIANGHKKMAYLGPAPLYQCLLDKMGGFYETVRDAGLSLSDQTTSLASLEEMPEVVRQLVEASDGPTALICAEEETGTAVLDEVKRLGMHLPDDLSVLVYDDVSWHPLSESTNILRNDFLSMGEAAGDLLKKLIDGECSGPVSIRLPAEFLPRMG